MNKWVSHQGITAGWPSALLWHKQRGHVPLLSAEGTPPHIITEQGSLAPYRWFLVLFFGICLFRDNPLFPATCYSEDEIITLTTYWTQQANGETRSREIRWKQEIKHLHVGYSAIVSALSFTVHALCQIFHRDQYSVVQFQILDYFIIFGLQLTISFIID